MTAPTMSDQERALLPCPFCGEAVMLRGALWPSDGDTDGIIHAASTDCPLMQFSIDTADGGVIAAWNRRALLAPQADPKLAEALEAARRITTAASYKDGVSYVYDADIQLVARALLAAAERAAPAEDK